MGGYSAANNRDDYHHDSARHSLKFRHADNDDRYCWCIRSQIPSFSLAGTLVLQALSHLGIFPFSCRDANYSLGVLR